MKLMEDMLSPSPGEDAGESVFARERGVLGNCKKAAIAVLGAAAQKFRDKAQDQQEVLAAASNIIMAVFGIESAILRTEKLIALRGEAACANHIEAARVFASDAVQQIEHEAKVALAAISEDDELRMMLAALRRYMKFVPVNVIASRRKIADSMVESGRYHL
jgi:hypothetical protein